MSNMPEPLFVEERRRIILERLKQEGRVSVNELSEAMRVSAVTIRQDLRALEESQLLERTYGGAVVRSPAVPLKELAFDIRRKRNWRAKEAIGAAAAAMVKNDDAVALDGSTTAFALVPHLKKLDRMTIVTNSLIIAQSFLDNPGFQVLMPGGRLRPDSISLVGHPEDLPDINLNIGFFGAHGISSEGGITDVDPDEVAMKKAMIARCVCTVIIADGSKWGRTAPYPFVNSTDVDRIVTTSDAPEALVERFRESGVRVDALPV
jgi:DeoR/GlpR family transcriptional regulator of sugar metabolism